MGYRISIDVGGTFTDLTIAEEKILLGRHKSPTIANDLNQGIINCLKLASNKLNITIEDLLKNTEEFIHASTTATNAILEGKGVKCGVICTMGTKHTLWRGEGRRTDLFNYKVRSPNPLVRPYLCLEVSERINKDGEILIPLNEDDVRVAVRQFKLWNVKTIAVCLLWSIINPVHEKMIGEIIRDEWPEISFSLSCEIQPIIREYHRMSCVCLNAMVQPIVSEYLEQLRNTLFEKGFKGDPLIVLSSGGIVPLKEVMKQPVFLLFSGPSMGPVSGKYYAEKNHERNSIVVDMGGTSFDVSTVIDNKITVTHDSRINNHPTGVSANEILTLGAGGGSIAFIDSAGMMKVGPQSAGSFPGPACYMRGGTEPTVTDACVVLGYIIPDYFLDGRMKISSELAIKAIKDKIADPLNLTVEDGALGIYQIAREKMVGGILNMTVRRGIDPREFIIVSGGGATGLFVADLAKELKIKRVIIPRETAALCAFGALNADISFSLVASKYSNSGEFNYEQVNRTLGELEVKGKEFLKRLGTQSENWDLDFYCSARYPMQVTEVEVSLRTKRINKEYLSKLVDDFHEAHLTRYKTADRDSPVEFVMWRSVARNCIADIELSLELNKTKDNITTLIGKQKATFESKKKFVEISYYNGEKPIPNMKIAGPAIIVFTDTTILVPHRFTIHAQENGYYIMEVPD